MLAGYMTAKRAYIARSLIASVCLLAAVAPASSQTTDEWLKKPVDDRTFKTFLELFTYDRSLPFDLRTLGQDEHEGIRREHLSFVSTPGVRVFAHLYQPPGGTAATSPTVILLHGGVATGKESSAVPARILARAGFNVLAFDMQHFGERSSDLLTTFTEQEKHERLYNQQAVYLAWVAQTVKDVGRAFDLLTQERRADRRRIGIVGASRGAMAAAIAGGADPRLALVVMVYGGHFDALERGHQAAACPANYIRRISPRPLLMLNGTFDADMLKDSSVEPLFRLAGQPKQVLWSVGGHMALSEQNQALMLKWLRENLK